MNVSRYLGAALVTASATIVPIGASPAVADSVTPYPCDSVWLPAQSRGICDNDPTAGPVPPDGPLAPVAPRGPMPSGPGGLR
jgi:hypothetical protein